MSHQQLPVQGKSTSRLFIIQHFLPKQRPGVAPKTGSTKNNQALSDYKGARGSVASYYLGSSTRLLIFQNFGVNHNPRVAPKTVSSLTVKFHPRIKRLLAPLDTGIMENNGLLLFGATACDYIGSLIVNPRYAMIVYILSIHKLVATSTSLKVCAH